LTDPGVQRAFGVILSQRLYYPNSKAVFSLLKIKNCFTNRSALLLFPLKNFFYVAVLDNRYALVKIEKPLNNVGHGVEIDVACNIPSQRRKVERSLLFANVATVTII
jgi:hypothetical protein